MGIVRPSAGRIVAEIDGVTPRARRQDHRGDRRPRHRAGAGRAAPVPAADRRGEPAARRVPAEGARADQARTSISASRRFPRLRERARQLAGSHERRRAADAGARARADAGAANPADRRAVGRPRADPGEPHHRHDQGAQGPLPAHRADGGAELHRRRSASPTAAMSSCTARSRSRAARPTSSTTTS